MARIPLIPFFHVFHGQRVAPDRAHNLQYVIENRETVSLIPEIRAYRDAQWITLIRILLQLDPDDHNLPGPNHRTRILNYNVGGQGQQLFWQPGNPQQHPFINQRAAAVQEFGNHLRVQGILTGDNFPSWDRGVALWRWDKDPNQPGFYASETFGEMQNDVRHPPADMHPDRGWPPDPYQPPKG